MANPRAGRHHAKVVERRLAPFQERITFHISLILAVDIHLKRARVAELIDHHRMVNHQIHGVQRIDLLRVAAKCHNPVTHRRKVHNGRDPSEILHQDAGRAVVDFARVLPALHGPLRKRLNVINRHRASAILKPQHVFQNDLQCRRKP